MEVIKYLSNSIVHILHRIEQPQYTIVENPQVRLGFSAKSKQIKEQKTNPRWIGRDVKVYPNYVKNEDSNSRKSPVPHTRKEHKRKVRYGKGRKLIKEVII